MNEDSGRYKESEAGLRGCKLGQSAILNFSSFINQKMIVGYLNTKQTITNFRVNMILNIPHLNSTSAHLNNTSPPRPGALVVRRLPNNQK